MLPAYCVPSYLVHLNEIPIHQVSGKCDYKALPAVTAATADADAAAATDALPVLTHVARLLRCGIEQIDPAVSFHDLGAIR